MGAVVITVDDLSPFADISEGLAVQMIEDAIAMASAPWVAPCILDVDFKYEPQAKAIIRGAILRWNDAGTGTVTQQSAGPFGQTVTTAGRKRMFWPSEVVDLQRLCGAARSGRAFTIDTTPAAVL